MYMDYVKNPRILSTSIEFQEEVTPVRELPLLALAGSSVWNCSDIPAEEHEFKISTNNVMNY
jgi:hypothetical protein